jgi:beta-glucosidase
MKKEMNKSRLEEPILQLNKIVLLLFITSLLPILVMVLSGCGEDDNRLYTNPEAPVEKRVENLLSQMTLEEKIAQMTQDAPTNDRLGIPLMKVGECLHGLKSYDLKIEGATWFPQAIGLGSTWNLELIGQIAASMAIEARQVGITHCYSPVLDVVRDPRYGRVEECYGEDPFLVGRMGVAFIQGLQGMGEERFNENHILATGKHYAAYSEPQQGLNGAYIDISKRTLYEIFLPPFEKAVKEARVGCIMPSHSDLNGTPCHMNEWLLVDLLRNKWGFDGYIESDNNDIYRLHGMHRVAESKEDAAILALRAGVDMDLVLGHIPEFMSYIPEVLDKAINKDPAVVKYIDTSVKRILKAKFELGLFESYMEPTTTVNPPKEHQELSLRAARESIILLKNDKNLLPLNENHIRSIAVVGPNAHDDVPEERVQLLGGYSEDPPVFISLYSGLKNKLGDHIRINYAEGCKILGNSKQGFGKALEVARESNIIVMALGGSTLTCGEGRDRDELVLTGMQEELLREMSTLGKPVILVMINGRPLCINWAAENVPAILEAWYPGMYGGEAIADILFGDYNPGGKLPVSFPRSIGQLPVSYLQKPDFIGSGKGEYIGKPDKTPLFHFGFGLSYTTFTYDSISLDRESIPASGATTASIVITNTGARPGDEIVQLYIRDNYASVGRYNKMLKGFKKISLKPGESKTVKFDIGFEQLHLFDREFNKVVEPGEFTILIGSSSRDQDLKGIQLMVTN